MRLKDKITIKKMIRTCIIHPHYPAAIFVNDIENAKLIFNKVLNEVSKNEIKKIYNHFKSSPNDGRIRFLNGSVIDIYTGSGYQTLPRYATIIYDNSLDTEYVNDIVLKTAVSIQRNHKLLHSIHKIKFNK